MARNKRFIVIFVILLGASCGYGTMGISLYSTGNSMRKKTIIFDLEGVLFQENKVAFAKKVGVGALARYTLSSWASPESICLDTLEKISSTEPNQPSIPLRHRNKNMPCCIIDWQLGKASQVDVRKQLRAQIEALGRDNFFKNEQEQLIVEKLLDVSIDPKHLADIAKPVPAMINLAKQLKQHGYQLFILSNLAQEPYDILRAEHPDIVALFDDIIISAQVGMLKPHKEIYEYIIQKYHLNPATCVFIDNQEDNIQAAEQLGILGIVHKNSRTTKNELAKLGIK